MTETMTAPAATATDYQSVALDNIRMMLAVRGLKQSDLAAYMGKHRQNLNRMINTGATWSFNDMCRAAQFFGVGVDTLMRSDLSQSELRGNGGLPVVAVDDSRRRWGMENTRPSELGLAA
ncbi:helix-turn-helix domain-containing protein [Bifidobacterium amazonense]|uniref:Helix-turn-helix domain-containing protein n=1 Tax=Bifidobacterium amazonense TaxID=2809027 RepID=A0ABS9VW34_9BIFI|nr:helix-turn-helix transcriptional regulator [Bifidobacterium amazonense]MCH9276131.1 helix-turn-helix domain-containing protein [Bifidobacterium amazonense]